MDFNYLIGRKITNTGFSNYPAPITISKIDHNKDLGIVDIYTEEYGQGDPSLSLLDDANNMAKFLEGKNVHGWELISEENPIEDAFSNTELFVREYKDYLIGKSIESRSKKKIEKSKIVNVQTEKLEGNDYVQIEINSKEEPFRYLYSSELQNFIDGELINQDDDNVFKLILQEEDENLSEEDTDLMNATILWDTLTDEELEKVITNLGYKPSKYILDDGNFVTFETLENASKGKQLKEAFIEYSKNPKVEKEEVVITEEEKKPESKYNKPEHKYYTVNEKNKICSGHEYKEDAIESRREILKKGKKASIYSLRELKGMGIDPDNNDNWWIETIDVDFIQSVDDLYGLKSEELIENKYSMLKILENALTKESKHINKYLILGSDVSRNSFNESKSKLEKILNQISVIINK